MNIGVGSELTVAVTPQKNTGRLGYVRKLHRTHTTLKL